MLELHNVEVRYSNVILALRGVSLKADQGKIIAILGANGAGKSTTLKAISGLLKNELGEVTRGSIVLDGQRIDNKRPVDIVKMGIIQVIEGHRVLEQLTTEENLRAGAYMSRNGSQLKNSLERVYAYFPRLRDLKNQTSGYLSGGEQQMLVIGRALMSKPSIILLDEPSLGLSPLMVVEIFRIIKEINNVEKPTILLVEQNAMAALALAEYGYIMEQGRIVLDGIADKLKHNKDVQEFYLGLSEPGKRKSYQDVKHYKRRRRWLG